MDILIYCADRDPQGHRVEGISEFESVAIVVKQICAAIHVTWYAQTVNRDALKTRCAMFTLLALSKMKYCTFLN